jgi:hypothetical protein
VKPSKILPVEETALTGEEAHWSQKRKAQDPEGEHEQRERRMENRMKETNTKRETD